MAISWIGALAIAFGIAVLLAALRIVRVARRRRRGAPREDTYPMW